MGWFAVTALGGLVVTMFSSVCQVLGRVLRRVLCVI